MPLEKTKKQVLAFHNAIKSSDLTSMRLFLQREPSLVHQYIGEYSALGRAIESGSLEIIDFLLNAGADPNGQSEYRGRPSPLHFADEASAIITQRLLEAGAKIDIRNASGATPLMCAAYSKNVALVQLLVDMGANVNAVDLDGENMLHYAVGLQGVVPGDKEQAAYLEIARIGIGCGADISVQNIDKKTPLQLAIEMSHFNMVKFLIQQGSDLPLKIHDLNPNDEIKQYLEAILLAKKESLELERITNCSHRHPMSNSKAVQAIISKDDEASKERSLTPNKGKRI